MSETELRAIDVEIAEKVMGWRKETSGDSWLWTENGYISWRTEPVDWTLGHTPPFSSRLDKVALVEARIAELGLQKKYIDCLIPYCTEGTWFEGIFTSAIEFDGWNGESHLFLWQLATVGPEERCRAALAAVEGSKEK